MSQHEKNNFWMPNKKYPEGLDPEYDELRRMQDYRDGNMTYYRPDNNIGFSVSTYNGEQMGWLIPDTLKSVGSISSIYLINENNLAWSGMQPPILYGKTLWQQLMRKEGLAKAPYPYPTEEELRECEDIGETDEYHESRE